MRSGGLRSRGRGLRSKELALGSVSPAGKEIDDGPNPVEHNDDDYPDDLVVAWRFVLGAIDNHPDPEREEQRPENAHAAVKKEQNEKGRKRVYDRESVRLHE